MYLILLDFLTHYMIILGNTLLTTYFSMTTYVDNSSWSLMFGLCTGCNPKLTLRPRIYTDNLLPFTKLLILSVFLHAYCKIKIFLKKRELHGQLEHYSR